MRVPIEQVNMKQAMRRRLNEQARVFMKEAEEAAFAVAKASGHADVYVPQMDRLDKAEREVVLDMVKMRLRREEVV